MIKNYKKITKIKKQKNSCLVQPGRENNPLKWNHPGGKFRRLGSASCTETELLAIILGSGSRGKPAKKIADEILDKYKNLAGMMGISLRELMKIKGLKEVKATQLAAVFEISRRIVKHLEKA